MTGCTEGAFTSLAIFDWTTNRVQRFTYDPAANVLNDLNQTYTYDGDGRLVTVDNMTGCAYDYQRDRVRTVSGGAETQYVLAGVSGGTGREKM